MTDVAELEALLVVQDLDTAITQLTHRRSSLPERAELAALARSLADNERRASVAQAERDELAAHQAALEVQIDSVNARRKAIEDRLYSARGTAARDLQAMDEEIKHLGRHREELEDAELELMVVAEPLDTELGELAQEATKLRDRAGAAQVQLTVAEREVDVELGERKAARDEAAATVPAELLGRYETLRTRLGGTGAARLVGSRCDGCHLELPSMEVERIRHLPPGTVVTCDQCGRILVPVTGAGAHPPR